MKMTPAWMKATTEHLAEWGFDVSSSSEEEHVDEQLILTRTRYELVRGHRECLVLEGLDYPDRESTYWLEIPRWHGLSSFPYRLDSWRHRPGQVEFKYAIDPETGMGLSFFVKEEELSSPCPS